MMSLLECDVLSEKNHWLEMGRETHPNINYLSAWEMVRYSRFLVITAGLQIARGASHGLNR